MTQTINMNRTVTNNGFITKYEGPIFPASRTNQLTYDRFCFLGGLENKRLQRIQHQRGTHVYVTYHRIDMP